MQKEIKQSCSQILKKIADGNDNYVQHHHHNFYKNFRDHQTPEITLLACSDSRVQVNILGLEATNEIFVIHNIGNQIMPIFGSVDFGVMHLKTPLLLIMGHTHCGAIKSAFSNYEDESFEIISELDHLSIPFKHLTNNEYNIEDDWLHIVEKNVDYQVKLAVKKYHKQIEAGTLTVVGLIDDFINVYESGEGRLIIINLNGEIDIEKIKMNKALQLLSDEQKYLLIKREKNKH